MELKVKHTNLIEVLLFIEQCCGKLNEELKNKECNASEYFCFIMNDRLNFACSGIRVLLNNMYGNSNLEISSGIIARPILLDCMIAANAVIILNNEERSDSAKKDDKIISLDAFCISCLADGVRYIIRDIKNYYEKSNSERLRELRELREKLSIITTICKSYFEESTINSIDPKFKASIKQAEKTIQLYVNIKKSHLEDIAPVYERYNEYSKYEHFSALFQELTRLDFETRIKTLTSTIQIYFMHHIWFLTQICATLEKNNLQLIGLEREIKNKLLELQNYDYSLPNEADKSYK